MREIIPVIELEKGERYEIRRSRYALCEIDRLREVSALTDDDSRNFALLQEKYNRLEKFALRVAELEEEYLVDFDEEKRVIYERAKEQYEKMLAEVTAFEVATNGVANKAQKDTVDKMESLVISILCFDDQGATVRTREEAEDIWCRFVDKIGRENAREWLYYAFEYISGSSEVEETDPFVKSRREKAEQKAQMRKGIVKAK
jgi:hypothetical protein